MVTVGLSEITGYDLTRLVPERGIIFSLVSQTAADCAIVATQRASGVRLRSMLGASDSKPVSARSFSRSTGRRMFG
jgi:hypothetical protein